MSAWLPAIVEPRGTSSGNDMRPDGMTLSLWMQGKPLAWDCTCVDPLSASHQRMALIHHDLVTEKAEEGKRVKYEAWDDRCISVLLGQVPLVFHW